MKITKTFHHNIVNDVAFDSALLRIHFYFLKSDKKKCN